MREIKKFINATVHTQGCNLKCDYCYLAQHMYSNNKSRLALRNPVEYVLKAFSPERMGGICYITLVGDGETLLPDDIEDFIVGLVKQGHYLTIITNGTLVEKIIHIIERLKEINLQNHIYFSLSLHFLEIVRLGLKDRFTQCVNFLKEENISVGITLVLANSYIPVIEEIKIYCDELGIVPSVNLAINEHEDGEVEHIVEVSDEEYREMEKRLTGQKSVTSKLNNFYTKETGFCYAGVWSIILDITTGECGQCVNNSDHVFNFYDNIEKPLELLPVGNRCKAAYCICGFRDAWHLVPEKEFITEKETISPSDRFLSEETRRRFRTDLAKSNEEYSDTMKEAINQKNYELQLLQIKIQTAVKELSRADKVRGLKLAEELFEVDLDSHNSRVVQLIVTYGYALIEMENYDEAETLYGCWDDLKYSADYCFMMGTVFLKEGNIELAISCFEAASNSHVAVEEGINSWLPDYNLGVIYECLGDMKKAGSYYKKCENYCKAVERLQIIEGNKK
ncbi:MAG: radical SAM protein [Lachnospiraceae bacterium]|nr:radical SAM protein [Lachnospiraceae bacterium]